MISKTKLMVYGAIIILALIALDVMRRRAQKDETTSENQPTTSAAAIKNSDLNGFSTEEFTVFLPEIPKHASEAVPLPSGQGLIKYDMYLSQKKDGTTYMVSEIQYPNGFKLPAATDLLESVMKEMMAGNTNNQLKNMQKGTFQGSPCIDFEIANNQVFVKSKAFLAGKTLFVLTLIDRNLQEIDKQFETFVNSFKMQQKLPMTAPEVPAPEHPVSAPVTPAPIQQPSTF